MKVMKFGGAILRNGDGFTAMSKIIKSETEKPLIIIISAFSTATRALARSARLAESGDEKGAMKLLDFIVSEHKTFAKDIIKEKTHFHYLNQFYKETSERIRELLNGIYVTGDLTPRILDIVMSYGEYLALQTVDSFLDEQGISHTCIDAASVIVTNSDYGKAKPNISETQLNVNKILKPALKDSGVVLVQGFVARSTAGELTTMGMESSNLTSALLANLLGASELVFWTDVDGIRTADPKIAKITLPVKSLSYSDAYTLGVNGLKLLYPGMFSLIEEKKIRTVFCSVYKPDGDYTEINISNHNNKPILIYLEDLKLIKMSYKEYIGFKKQESARNSVFESFWTWSYPDFVIFFHNSASSKKIMPKNSSFQLIEDMSGICIINFSDKSGEAINRISQKIYNVLAKKKYEKTNNLYLSLDNSTIRIAADKGAAFIIYNDLNNALSKL